jgi:hypothetical protein
MPPMATEEIRWIARTLEAAVQAFGLSTRELESRLGWEEGSLDAVLSGRIELEPWHVVKILDGLTDDLATSAEVDLDDSGAFLVEELIGRFERLGYGSAELALPEHPPPDGPELERRIRTVLREAFGEKANGGEEPRADET